MSFQIFQALFINIPTTGEMLAISHLNKDFQTRLVIFNKLVPGPLAILEKSIGNTRNNSS